VFTVRASNRARIAADRLVRHLERSGFAVMKKTGAPAPTSIRHMPPRTDMAFAAGSLSLRSRREAYREACPSVSFPAFLAT
jgi:hypothetical protein